MRHLKKDLWPYQIISYSMSGKINDWCKTCIGRRSKEWYDYSDGQNRRIFAFKDEESLLAFKLTWSYNGN